MIKSLYPVCILLIFFIIHPCMAQDDIINTDGDIVGLKEVCSGKTVSYRYKGGQGFKRWFLTGNYTILDGTTVNTNPISVRWSSNGTIDVLTVEPTSGNTGVDVTLHPNPILTTTPARVEGRPGQEVTLSVSGASSYFWTGPGLITNTGSSVNAILPTEEDFVYSVTGSNGYCTDTKLIGIDLLFIDAGPDRTYCKSLGSIDLIDWGLSLTEGSWSGPGITVNQLDLTQLETRSYTYTYTRTSDGAFDKIVLTAIQSVGGNASLAIINSCGPLTGSIALSDFEDNIIGWEKSYDNGVNWVAISSTANPYEYFESKATIFRAVVQKDNCSIQNSNTVSISPAFSKAGTIIPDITTGCNSFAGSLTVSDTDGTVSFWEKSLDDVNWTVIPNSALTTLTGISENKYTGFRAAVSGGGCPVAKTIPVFFEPLAPVGGFLNSTSLQLTCDLSTGSLALQNSKGDSYDWKKSTDGTNWISIPEITGTSYSFEVTVETKFQVTVRRNNACEPAFSSIFTAFVSSYGGTTNTSNSSQCGTASGNIFLTGSIGNIQYWQHSADNQNWNKITSSDGLTTLPFTTSEPLNFYRAVIKSGECPEVFSTVSQVNVASPPVPGFVRLINDPDFVMVLGTPRFKDVQFELYDYAGQIHSWRGETSTRTDQINVQQNTLTLNIDQTTSIRAKVQSNGCDPLLSGQAIFVVNKPFLGIRSIFGIRDNDGKILGLPVSEYEGYSYQISGPGGVSLKENFSYHANKAQSFFVLLDDNYTAPPPDQNFVLEETILKEGVKNDGEVYFLNASDRNSIYTYTDGLNRPMQQVHRRASPERKDIVVPVGYDSFGRRDKDYLPFETNSTNGYFQNNAVSDQAYFYQQPPAKVASSDYPFAATVYENSPLNRVREKGAPGTDWQPGIGHPLKLRYHTNVKDEVKLWKLNESAMPEAEDYYEAGELYLNVLIDEHGNSIKEYRDKRGLVILKRAQNGQEWLDTYFIYDDFGLKRYEIQPEGMAILSDNPDQDFLDTWSFQYRFNARKLEVEKRIPGSGWLYKVYDGRDRLVLTQDANQRKKNQWTFIKYDKLNRPVITGIYSHLDPTNPSHIATRTEISDKVSTTVFAEEYTGQLPYGYTLDNTFPSQNLEVLSVTYYDNYDFIEPLFGEKYAYDNDAIEELPDQPFKRLKTIITGSQVRVLGAEIWLKDVVYYDKRYNVIQNVRSNHMNGVERTSQLYDFAGQVINRSVNHSLIGSPDIKINENFIYDHAGRMLLQTHQVNSGSKVNLKTQHYNSVGQIVEKNLHAIPEGYMQSVDYRYNIRGWLTHINNATLTHDGGVTNDDGNDYFGFELSYQNPSGIGRPQYNGNISETLWKSVGSNKQSYAYTYDAVNRLKQAIYFNLDNPLLNGIFNETVGEYDRNGNIRKMMRSGHTDELLFGEMDNLKYTYEGNRLMLVEDMITNTSEKEGGFKDGNKEGNDYAYDDNGSMTADKNKDIKSIAYNYLNLPEIVTKTSGETIKYVYDAAGRKLTETVNENNNVNKTTDYTGQFVYEDGVLQFILHDEGRVTMTNTQPQYDYFLKDHLGNVRMAFTTKEETETFTATLDNEPEDRKFLRYDNVRKVKNQLFDKTKDGTDPSGYAVRLSGGELEKVGLAKSLQILPGDKVHMEVYAKYVHPDDQANWSNAVAVLMNMFATGKLDATIIDGSDYGRNTDNLPFPTGTGENGNPTWPKAYLNYVFLNTEFDLTKMKMGVKRLSSAPRETGQNIAHEKLELEFEATEAGFLYVYLSNDNEEIKEEVFFDDFSITHEKSPIIQAQDFYPFGLTFNSYQRESSVPSRKKFQSQEHIDDLGLNWDSFKWRNYQPDVGRFFNVDPLAEKYVHNSTYAFAENKVITFRELEGLEGVHYMEGSNHIVEKNVIVLLKPKKNVPQGADAKKVKKIVRQNARIDRQNAAKIASVKSELNQFYNGPDGKGAQNNKGENVVFMFNIIPANDTDKADKKQTSEDDRNTYYRVLGVSNGLLGTNRQDPNRLLIAPAAVLTTEGARKGDFGETLGAIVIRMNSRSPEGGVSHEVLHTLGLPDNGYNKGGLLNSPPHSISSSEVDAVLKFSYEKD